MKKQRIILLPGFGEDARIFRNIVPHLSDYHLEIFAYQHFIEKYSTQDITLEDFVADIIEHFQITKEDLLIGHSLGGYLSHHIRQVVGCQNCMIASFTDSKKVRNLIHKEQLIKVAVMYNHFFTSPLFRSTMNFRYIDKPSYQDVKYVFEVFEWMGSENIFKKLLLLLRRKRRFMEWLRPYPDYKLAPSLFIHPETDWIVAPPDEDYIELPGDHFSVISRPTHLLEHIAKWLENANVKNAILTS